MKNMIKIVVPFLGIYPTFALAEREVHIKQYPSYISTPLSPSSYISLNIGYISPMQLKGKGYEVSKKPRDASNCRVALGYYINDGMRIELELNKFNPMLYRVDLEEKHPIAGQVKSTHTQTMQSLLVGANFYFDIINTQRITGYITGGGGISHNKAENYAVAYTSPLVMAQVNHSIPGKSTNNFAWNVGAGIVYKLDDRVYFDVLSIKYHELGKLRTQELSRGLMREGNLRVFSFMTGIRVNFGHIK